MTEAATTITAHATNVRRIIGLCERATWGIGTATREGARRAALYIGQADALAGTLPPALEDAMRATYIAPAYRLA